MIVSDEMLAALTPENRQRLEWRMRTYAWLSDRIAGTPEDKEQFLALWTVAIDRSFYEGTVEAGILVAKMAEGISQPVPLSFVAGKINELAEMNRISDGEVPL
jgi:hypothetical protein